MPKQERSRATLDAILEAAEQAFDGRSLGSIPLREITERAGVSVSSFYARFPDKESLLLATFVRVGDRILADTRARAAEPWEERGARTLAREAVALHMDHWRRYGPLIRTVKQAEGDDPTLRRYHARLERTVVNEISDVILRVLPWLRGARRLLTTTLFATAATAKASIDRPDHYGLDLDRARDELVDELSEMALRWVDDTTPLDAD